MTLRSMRFFSHLLYGLFSWVFAALWLDWSVAFMVFFFHMFPLVDVALKPFLDFEPFHTFWGWLGFHVIVYIVSSPQMFFLSIVGYTPHLILDYFVEEGMQLFYPNKEVWADPIDDADLLVQFGSGIGIIVLLIGMWIF